MTRQHSPGSFRYSTLSFTYSYTGTVPGWNQIPLAASLEPHREQFRRCISQRFQAAFLSSAISRINILIRGGGDAKWLSPACTRAQRCKASS